MKEKNSLKVRFLGGVGEIGKNMTHPGHRRGACSLRTAQRMLRRLYGGREQVLRRKAGTENHGQRKGLLTFTIPSQIGNTQYDKLAHTANILMPESTDRTSLAGNFTMAPGAVPAGAFSRPQGGRTAPSAATTACPRPRWPPAAGPPGAAPTGPDDTAARPLCSAVK